MVMRRPSTVGPGPTRGLAVPGAGVGPPTPTGGFILAATALLISFRSVGPHGNEATVDGRPRTDPRFGCPWRRGRSSDTDRWVHPGRNGIADLIPICRTAW